MNLIRSLLEKPSVYYISAIENFLNTHDEFIIYGLNETTFKLVSWLVEHKKV